MGAARTAFARANARLGVLAGIAAVVMLLGGLGAGVVDALAGAATGGLRGGLAATTGTDGATRWQTRLADDAEAQADAAASVLDRMLVPNGATWSRSVETAPVAATADTAGGSPFGAVLLADPGLADRADLVDGTWADATDSLAAADAEGAVATTLHAGAAADLGLATGDLVTVDGDEAHRLLVVGTWLPADANDPAWFGEPIIATGAIEGGAGPFVVDEDALTAVPAAVLVRWTAVPDTADLTPEQAAALRATLPNVEPALRDQPELGSSGLGATGDLGATLTRLLAGIGAVRAVAPLPVLVLAFAGLAALTRLATLLGAARRSETTLLRARGASAARLAGETAVEVLVVGVPAAIIGVLAAEAVLALTRPAEARDWSIAWLAASVALVAAVGIVAGRAFIDAQRPVVRGSGDEVGRAPRTAVAGGALLIAVAAAISLWQFRLYGSPLVTSASGRVDVDPVAVLAPVLVLLALSLLALGLTAAGRGAARAARGRSPRPRARVAAAPARSARRTLRVGVVRDDARGRRPHPHRLVRGRVAGRRPPDVGAHGRRRRARGIRRPRPRARTRSTRPRRPVRRASTGSRPSAPVFRGEIRIGSDPATLVAAPVGELAQVAPGTGADADRRPARGVGRGGGRRTSRKRLDARGRRHGAGSGRHPGRVAVSAWLLTSGGAATRLPAGEVDIAAGAGMVEDRAAGCPRAAPHRPAGVARGRLRGRRRARRVRRHPRRRGRNRARRRRTRRASRRPNPRPARADRPGAVTRCRWCSATELAARISAEVGRPVRVPGHHGWCRARRDRRPAPYRCCPRPARTPCSSTSAR